MESNKKLYSQKIILIATYFGGPVVTGILMRKNFKVLGKQKEGSYALLLGIISMLVVFAGLYFMPENIVDKIPNFMFPAIYTAAVYFILGKVQGKELNEHKMSGGTFYSGWKVFGFLMACIVAVAALAFLAGDLFSSPTNSSNFDTATYESGMTEFFENEAESLIVFGAFETESLDYIIGETKSNIELWRKNKAIINSISSLENLPDGLIEQNKKLETYCDLRVSHFRLLLKSMQENTNVYDDETAKIGLKIEQLIAELSN
jgi:hypothetical protein